VVEAEDAIDWMMSINCFALFVEHMDRAPRIKTSASAETFPLLLQQTLFAQTAISRQSDAARQTMSNRLLVRMLPQAKYTVLLFFFLPYPTINAVSYARTSYLEQFTIGSVDKAAREQAPRIPFR
jgi:hypothetical protein